MFGGKQQSGNNGQSQPQRKNTQGQRKQNNNQQNDKSGANPSNNNGGQQQQNKQLRGKKGGNSAAAQQQQNSNFTMQQQEDEAIISTSNNTSQAQASQKKGGVGTMARERALEKTSWLSASGPNTLNTLEELNSSAKGEFDQFAGKKTTYTDEFYTTTIDHSKVSKEDKKRAMQIENEIMKAPTQNRHFAEERNQVAPLCEGELNDEESKYGATDMKNQVAVTHQDGGVFEKGAKPAKKGGKKTASKNDSKELQNIPQGKFKVFKPSIDKNAIAEMTKGFLAEFVQKKASDTFLVPATVAASNTTSTNLQSKQKPAPVMNVSQSQTFTAPTQMRVPQTQAPAFNPMASSMTTQAVPFSATQPSQPFNVTPKPNPVQSMPAPSTAAPNPFAKAVTSVKDFTPGAKSFIPTQSAAPVTTQPVMPVPQATNAPVFTPNPSVMTQQTPSFQPTNMGAPSQAFQPQMQQAAPSFKPFNPPTQNQQQQMMPMPQGGQNNQQTFNPNNNMPYHQQNHQMPYRPQQQYGNNNQNSNYHHHNNQQRGQYNNNYQGNRHQNNNHYNNQNSGGNQFQMPNQHPRQQHQQHHHQQSQNQQYGGGHQNQNNMQQTSSNVPAMPMPMPSNNNMKQQQPPSFTAQQQNGNNMKNTGNPAGSANSTPAGQNPFANMGVQQKPQKK